MPQKARGIHRMRICCVPPPAARCSPAAYGAGQGASARSVASSRTIRLAVDAHLACAACMLKMTACIKMHPATAVTRAESVRRPAPRYEGLLAPGRRPSVAASTVVWHHQNGDEAHTRCRMRCISAGKARGIPRVRICCVPPPAAPRSPAADRAGQGASAHSVASSRRIRLAADTHLACAACMLKMTACI